MGLVAVCHFFEFFVAMFLLHFPYMFSFLTHSQSFILLTSQPNEKYKSKQSSKPLF